MTTDVTPASAAGGNRSASATSIAFISSPPVCLEPHFLQLQSRGQTTTRVGRLHQPQALHEPRDVEAEVVFVLRVAQPQKLRVMVMVVLQARAERGRHGKPVADV